MNDVVMKGLLKMVKNFVSPEQIKEAAGGLIKMAIDYKNKVVIDPDQGETQVIAIFYEVHQTVYFALAILDKDDTIIRCEQLQQLDTLIDNLINKL